MTDEFLEVLHLDDPPSDRKAVRSSAALPPQQPTTYPPIQLLSRAGSKILPDLAKTTTSNGHR